MTSLPLALSISNTLLKAGALAAVAGLVGIAVLSLLVFSQARELKRLREWAGRAPERAAELEQRVLAETGMRAEGEGLPASVEAAIRIQRTVQPVPRPPGAVVPRVTPVVARATAVEPAAGVAGAVALSAAGEPVPGQPAFVPTAQTAVATAAHPAPSSNGPGPTGQPATAAGSVLAAADPKPVEPADAQKPVSTPPAEEGAPEPPPVASNDAQSEPAVAEAKPEPAVSEPEPAVAEAEPEPSVPAPVTVAALAAASGSAAVASRVLEPAHSPAARATAPPAPARAPTPPLTRPPLPPRPSAPPRAAGSPGPARPSASPRPGGEGSRGRGEEAGLQGRGETGFQFLRDDEPPPRRTTALIVGGVVVGVVVLAAVLLLSGGGSSNKSPGSTPGVSTASGAHGAHHGSVVVVSPAETHVVVLNATETNGLAHQLSGNLQRSGYTLAAALSGAPPARSTSVVEYANGHRTEAQHVGQTLGIGEVQPLEGAVAPLVNGATVVVIAGADQAAASSGETPAGTSTGASPGAGEAQGAGATPAGGEAAAGATG